MSCHAQYRHARDRLPADCDHSQNLQFLVFEIAKHHSELDSCTCGLRSSLYNTHVCGSRTLPSRTQLITNPRILRDAIPTRAISCTQSSPFHPQEEEEEGYTAAAAARART